MTLHTSGILLGHADALSRRYESNEFEPSTDYKSQILSRIVAVFENPNKHNLRPEPSDIATDADLLNEEDTLEPEFF